MSTTIGSVTLDYDMPLVDEYNYKLVNASVEKTIGGGVVIQEFGAVEKGRELTLQSTESIGFQLKSTIDALMALAAISGATYTLTITTTGGGSLTKTVRFRNEVDGGAVQFEPHQQRDGIHADTTYYGGAIYLMVV